MILEIADLRQALTKMERLRVSYLGIFPNFLAVSFKLYNVKSLKPSWIQTVIQINTKIESSVDDYIIHILF